MEFKELVLKNRSYRRFYQDVKISRDTLVELIDLARLTGSGSNRQPLKYCLSCDPDLNARIFPNTLWAAYLKEWPGPEEGERPSAYIVIVEDKSIGLVNPRADLGISAQTILLGAVEKGYGGCMIASFKKKEIAELFNLPEDKYEPLLVIALGKPKEVVVIDEVGPDGDIKYWRDENQVHHVPKRALKDIILN
ncbi:MAG: nitroreductase family protein [Clostridia bacterium]|nr:nitroreductase family protein [Clostridia bacterium]